MDSDQIKRRQFIQMAGYLGVGSLVAPEVSRANTLHSELESPAQGAPRSIGSEQAPLAIHPGNRRYLLFREKPIVLVAACEHYGSIVNRCFDFERYLAEAADKKQTVTRTFLLYRELQAPRNPCSPLKPESPDFIAPWPRTGPGKAMDGEPKYDLDQWNPEYFARLHQFLSLASKLGIVVELTVFSYTYSDSIWGLNPLRDKNNLQEIGRVEWPDYTSLHDRKLVERQSAYATKIIQETSIYDNVYYEVCNEPGGGRPGHATAAEVDDWQQAMATIIRGELRKLERKHLISGQSSYTASPFYHTFDTDFTGSMLDIVNVHAWPDLTLRGRAYQLGHFMSKELQLKQWRDFFLAAYQERKPCSSDEDNAASLYLDDAGWIIVRKRAWTAILSGGHYDSIDFSIKAGIETGTEESRLKIRSWMRNLSEFIHSFDFIHARPLPDWITTNPAYLICSVLAKPGEDYIAYLGDARELTEPDAGQPINGNVSFHLPEGSYEVSLYSPRTGEYSPALLAEGENIMRLQLPLFTDDIAVRVTRRR